MKDRMTLGRAGDVRDLTADIGADPYATERVFAAIDYEHDRRREKNRVDAALPQSPAPDFGWGGRGGDEGCANARQIFTNLPEG